MRPDIRASLPASLTHELRLNIRKPDSITPLSAIHDDMVRAFKIGAVNEDLGRAGFPHFAESDLNGPFHSGILAAPGRTG
jgi:hypothetical protein